MRLSDEKARQLTWLVWRDRVRRLHLDDGRDVDAVSLFRIAPTVGSHVVVNEARHASGKLSYDIVRLAE